MIWSAGRLIRISLAKQMADGPFIWVVALSYWTLITVYLIGLLLAPLIPIAAWKTRRERRTSAAD